MASEFAHVWVEFGPVRAGSWVAAGGKLGRLEAVGRGAHPAYLPVRPVVSRRRRSYAPCNRGQPDSGRGGGWATRGKSQGPVPCKLAATHNRTQRHAKHRHLRRQPVLLPTRWARQYVGTPTG